MSSSLDSRTEILAEKTEIPTLVIVLIIVLILTCCAVGICICWKFCQKKQRGGLIISRPPAPTPEQTPTPTFQGTSYPDVPPNPPYTGSSVYPNLTPGYNGNNPTYPGGNLTPYNSDPSHTRIHVPAYNGDNLTPKDSTPSREANLTPGFNEIQVNVTPGYGENKINVGENLNPGYSANQANLGANTMPAYNLSPFYPGVRGPPGNVGNQSLLVGPSAVFAGSRNSLNKDECGV